MASQPNADVVSVSHAHSSNPRSGLGNGCAGLRVCVIGGSIGGLSAAIALSRAGADVRIYERRSSLPDEGAGVVLRPTGIHALTRLGIELSRPVPWIWDHASVRSGHACIRIERTVQAQEPHTYAGLRHILLQAARALPLRLGTPVAQASARGHRAVFVTEGGAEEEVDLVVAADGVDSKTRASLFSDLRPSYREVVLFRGFLTEAQAQRFLSEPLVRMFDGRTVQFFGEAQESGWLVAHLLPGPNAGEGKRFQWVFYLPSPRNEQDELLTDVDGAAQRWATQVDKISEFARRRLREVLSANYPRQLLPVVEAGSIRVHRVADLVVPQMTQGGLALLGDAAHIVPPWTGGGASLAMADAASLAAILSESGSTETGLATWNAERLAAVREIRAQANRIQALTLDSPPNLFDAPEGEARRWVQEMYGPQAMAGTRIFDCRAQPLVFGE